jgi:hypothetical protein
VSITVENTRTEEGLIAHVSGPVTPFSLRVGKGQVRYARDEHALYWIVEEGVCAYHLQLLLQALPEGRGQDGVSPVEILIGHLRWAVDASFRHDGRGITASGGRLVHFPTGEEVLFWSMAGRSAGAPAVAVSAHASTLHSGHVLFLSVEGIGSNWGEDALETKCLRCMLSVFRHREPVPPNRPHPETPAGQTTGL